VSDVYLNSLKVQKGRYVAGEKRQDGCVKWMREKLGKMEEADKSYVEKGVR
jgi:hypothetical protein